MATQEYYIQVDGKMLAVHSLICVKQRLLKYLLKMYILQALFFNDKFIYVLRWLTTMLLDQIAESCLIEILKVALSWAVFY